MKEVDYSWAVFPLSELLRRNRTLEDAPQRIFSRVLVSKVHLPSEDHFRKVK